MDKMDKNGMDLGKANIERLKEIFPECVADGKVNFDALRVALGDDIDTSKEKYSFNWVGKANAMKIALTPSAGTLIPCKEKSKDWDTTENMYIEGDNLEVLKILEKTYHNKIKMIYIDPPYNTGKDFVYHDDFHDNIQNYLDNSSQAYRTNPETAGRFHTDWLNMMYPRLKIARELLTDDGAIFISIDDNEQSNLKKMCDEIFGESNFVCNIPRMTSAQRPSQEKYISTQHDYILIYVKHNDENNKFARTIKRSGLEKVKKDEIGLYFEGDTSPILASSTQGYSKGGDYDFEYQGIIYKPIANDGTRRRWLWTIDRMNAAAKLGILVPTKTGLRVKNYIDKEFQLKTNVMVDKDPNLILASYDLMSAKYANNHGTSLLNSMDIKFDFSKPINLILELAKLIKGNDYYVLDFFSGSATTAHAVMQLNAQDAINAIEEKGHIAYWDKGKAGKRKFIMVQLPEVCNEMTAHRNICDIGEKRIAQADKTIALENLHDISNKLERRILEVGVDEGITSKMDPTLLEIKAKGQQQYVRFYLYDGMDNSKEINQTIMDSLDLGFKVFKLDSTNIKPWDATVQYDEQTIFELNDDVIKEGRRDIDVVYEIMLKYGVFNMPLKQDTINGKSVYSVGGGYMLISLNDEITTDDVLEIAKRKPKAVVFKESGFVDDNAKINADYTLKRFGVDNVKCI